MADKPTDAVPSNWSCVLGVSHTIWGKELPCGGLRPHRIFLVCQVALTNLNWTEGCQVVIKW